MKFEELLPHAQTKSIGMLYQDLCPVLHSSVSEKLHDITLSDQTSRPITPIERKILEHQMAKESNDVFTEEH